MSAENTLKAILEVASTVAPESMAHSYSREEIERRLEKRAQQIRDRIKRSEESQRCTNEIMRFQFHGPGEG